MARVKYHNNDNGKWVYADSAYGNGGSDGGTQEISVEWTKGQYIYYSSNTIGVSSAYALTNYIDVSGFDFLKIRTQCLGSTAGVVLFDSNQTYLSGFLPGNGIMNTVDVSDAAFVRISCTVSYLDNVVIEPTTFSAVTDQIMNGWYNTLGDRMKHLLSKATQKKICCIVDDDTVNVASVQLLKDACDANKIKATMACLTTNIERESNAGLTEKLLEMEQNGFQVVLHAHTQTGYKNDPDHEDDIWLNPETNAAKCEADLVQGLQKMEAAGFTDYKYWVTPYCKDGEVVQRMARKWGMKCLLAGGNAYEPADDTNGRYAIRRAAFGISDDKADSSITLARLQAIAQDAANNNGWLVIMTHFEQWQKAGGDYKRFTELINYLKNDLKYEFMTVGEAWSYRKAIYDVFDMF